MQHHQTAEDFARDAQAALIDQSRPVREVWQSRIPPGHQLHEDHRGFAISTAGARAHASEELVLEMARRLLAGDWGLIQYQQDRDQNDRHAKQERGAIMGIYEAPDGTTLWALQSHRFLPPTIMLPEER